MVRSTSMLRLQMGSRNFLLTALAACLIVSCHGLPKTLKTTEEVVPETQLAPVELVDLPSGASIKMWFGYAKEELTCFRGGAADRLIGTGTSAELFDAADMIVLLELAKKPSQADMQNDADKVDFDMPSCEEVGATPLDQQMNNKLSTTRPNFVQVQIHQYAEDDAEEADQSLLSIWYNPAVVTPGNALALKNALEATSNCSEVAAAKSGPVAAVIRDRSVKQCGRAFSQTAWQYATSKSSLITSWTPNDGSEAFAIFGSNLPSGYFKGKNVMLERAMNSIETELSVKQSRVFIMGDMNTRLLNSVYAQTCADPKCHEPTDRQQALQLSKRSWEIIPGRTAEDDDLKPCKEHSAFSSKDECEQVYDDQTDCRVECIGNLFCDSSAFSDAHKLYEAADPKRGAGGFDLLATYFTFPSDTEMNSADPTISRPRLPTYKKTPNEDFEKCDQTFLGDYCSDNYCTKVVLDSAQCTSKAAEECFKDTRKTKSDVLPASDPLSSQFPDIFVKSELGYLDTFGYSKALEQDVTVTLFEDRPDLTFGDHGSFVAALAFDASSTPTIRLVGGANDMQGRVEVFQSGSWGTVCDDDWSTADAQVVCRQLRFEGQGIARGYTGPGTYGGHTWGEGTGPIHEDNVHCRGDEDSLAACPARHGSSDCAHHEDAGVDCDVHEDAPTEAPTEEVEPVCRIIIAGEIKTCTGSAPCDSGRDSGLYTDCGTVVYVRGDCLQVVIYDDDAPWLRDDVDGGGVHSISPADWTSIELPWDTRGDCGGYFIQPGF